MRGAETFDYVRRRKGFREAMLREGLDGLLVCHLPDVRYLCGFSGSSGMVLLLRDRGYFLSDSRYREQAAREVSGLRTAIYAAGPEEAVARLLRRRSGLRLGFDPGSLPYAAVLSLRRALRGSAGLVPLGDSLAALRARKDRGELEVIRRGVRLAEAAFQAALGQVGEDTREADLAAAIDIAARAMGAEGPAFETIVAGGTRAALVHARPTARRLGGAVVVDWGVVYRGYRTDTTRTLTFGKVKPVLRRAHRLVLDAQQRALEAIRPGVRAREVDRAARELIERAGFGDAFGHGLGHGVGLEVHERPHIGRESRDVLEEGMVFTVEPGIYIPGVGGVRVEDMVLVRRDGPELLT